MKTSRARAAKAVGIKVLGGADNKYPEVPLMDIHVVERPEEGHEEEQLFYNARDLESMDSETMRDLRDSIAESGLHTPLIVRAITGDKTDDGTIVHIDLVAGERRLRSLLKLYEDNTVVYDWRTKTRKGAQEVWTHVPCEVWYNIPDEEALSLSWVENFIRQNLSIREEINLVERLIRRGLKQEEIAVRLKTNVTWVSQTYNFRNELPNEGFERLLDGRMSRHVAVKILEYHLGDRPNLVKKMIEIEQQDSEAAAKRAERLVEDAEDDEDVIKAAAKKAPQKPQFKKKLATAARKIVEAKARRLKVEDEAGTCRQSHVQRAAVAVGASTRTAKVLTKMMIQQFHIDVPTKWIETNKIDPLVHKPYPHDKLLTIAETARAVLSGDIDTGAIVRRVLVKTGEWKLPEGVRERKPEFLEVEDGDEELD